MSLADTRRRGWSTLLVTHRGPRRGAVGGLGGADVLRVLPVRARRLRIRAGGRHASGRTCGGGEGCVTLWL